MAYQNFAETLYVHRIPQGSIVPLTTFTLQRKIYLKYIRLGVYFHGYTFPGDYLFIRAQLFDSDNKLLIETSFLDMQDIVTTAGYWLGWLNISFSDRASFGDFEEIILPGLEYELRINIVDPFMANHPDSYVGIIKDYPIPIYDDITSPPQSIADQIMIYGDVKRSDQ